MEILQLLEFLIPEANTYCVCHNRKMIKQLILNLHSQITISVLLMYSARVIKERKVGMF